LTFINLNYAHDIETEKSFIVIFKSQLNLAQEYSTFPRLELVMEGGYPDLTYLVEMDLFILLVHLLIF
jgi:hypothetical protein